MKQRLAALVSISAAVVAYAPAAFADDDVGDDVSTSITTNPLGLLSGRINFEIEREVADPLSLYAGIAFLLADTEYRGPNGRLFGVGPDLGLRFFLLGDAPEGLFVGPYLNLAYIRATGAEPENVNGTAFGYSAGLMGGATIILFDTLVGSVGVGGGYDRYIVEDEDGTQVGYTGFSPRFRLAVGVAF